eukprot:GHVS01065052.1.p2 GENE.GHVS01065052.1~~GHVS01065052.1.p2  ORF type:complete len:374 (+),score=69.21 GHVS01065052.1:3089-4210(+)
MEIDDNDARALTASQLPVEMPTTSRPNTSESLLETSSFLQRQPPFETVIAGDKHSDMTPRQDLSCKASPSIIDAPEQHILSIPGTPRCSCCQQVDSCRCFSTLEAAFSHALLHLRCLHDYIASLPSSVPSAPLLPKPPISPYSTSLYDHLVSHHATQYPPATLPSKPSSTTLPSTCSIPLVRKEGVLSARGGKEGSSAMCTPASLTDVAQPEATGGDVMDRSSLAAVDSASATMTTTTSSGRLTSIGTAATHASIEASECRLAKALLLLTNLRQANDSTAGTTVALPLSNWFYSSPDRGRLLESLVALQQQTQVLRSSCLLLRVDMLYLCSEVATMVSQLKTAVTAAAEARGRQEQLSRSRLQRLQRVLLSST